ncbi:MAG: DUF3165 domain-containing protein [Lactococcus sp.]
MLYIILLILAALVYFFVMPKDIRRSIDVFVFVIFGVLIFAVAISQAVMNQTLILEILLILAGLAVTAKAWVEVGQLGHKQRRRDKNRK